MNLVRGLCTLYNDFALSLENLNLFTEIRALSWIGREEWGWSVI